jgi:F0F1-type ATP synthase epsilon subunit
MQMTIQIAIMTMTVMKTGMLSRKFSREKTVEKSIVFGGTAKLPPNDVR